MSRFLRPSVVLQCLCVPLLAITLMVGLSRIVSSESQDDMEAAIGKTILNSASAFERNDIAGLNETWAQDEWVTVFENGYANYGWVDYRDNHLIPEMAEMKNTKYTISDIQPHIAGKTAWATFTYKISADLKDRHVEGGGLGTAVVEERNGRWVIVHWHTSSPRKAATEKKD